MNGFQIFMHTNLIGIVLEIFISYEKLLLIPQRLLKSKGYNLRGSIKLEIN